MALVGPHPAGDVDAVLGRSQGGQEPGDARDGRTLDARPGPPGRSAGPGSPAGSVILLSAEETRAGRSSRAPRPAGAVEGANPLVDRRPGARDPEAPAPAGRPRRADAHAASPRPGGPRADARSLGDCRLIVFDPVSAYLGDWTTTERHAARASAAKAMADGWTWPSCWSPTTTSPPGRAPTASIACSARSTTSAPAGPTSCSSRTPTTRPAVGC